ncbi:MAG: thiol-disulfide isomerase, partial [Bryobacterales bacterium]|nr:thiol-disulfide isomerase [Bryobacterales bacterium]
AKLVKAGSDIVFQMHYTANGKAAKDRSKLGIVFAKEPPKYQVLTLGAVNGKFKIPPHADNHQVEAQFTLHADTELLALMPHMHVRGKSMRFELVDKGGQRQTLLDVPKYDFNWQMRYVPEEPLKLDAGSVIQCFAKFDNSPNNKHNPDPTKVVRWGDQSWEEMMIGFFNVSVPVETNPRDLLRAPKKPEPARSGGE